MGSPCDADVKWILRAGFNVDPSTLAKNLTILCTVAFSATVLYVMYSNSGKRPRSTDNIQVCFLDEEERSEDGHTTQCETRCRHSIVGSSDGSKPPDRLMSFGISLEDVQSPSSRRACRLDSTVDVDSTNDRLEDTGTLVAPDSNATNDVGILDVLQDNKCSENSKAGTLNLSSIATSDFNSCDVSTVAEVAADGNMTIAGSSCAQVAADGNMTITESPCTQVEPSATSTASGPDAIESSCTRTLPSTTTTTLDDPIVMESACTQNPPATTDTASGPDETTDVDRATGNLNDTSSCAPSSSGRARGPLSNFKCMSAGICTSDQPFGLSKERSEVHKETRFMRENVGCHYDPGCARTGVDLLRKCEESESQRRSRIDFNLRDADSAADLHWMEEEDDDDGSHFVGYIYGIIQEKGSKPYKRRLCEGVSIAKERMEQGQSDCFREKLALGEKFGIRYQDSCTQFEGGRTCDDYGSTGCSQKVVEEVRKTNFGTVCKDKGTSTSVDVSFDSTAREACMGRPLKQTNTISSKENTHRLPEKTYEKCRDKGTSTSADTSPASCTKGPSTGRPLKYPRTMLKEETRHLINDNLDKFERYAEERRERGIPSVRSQPADPLEQTKKSLKALTETQHWSKMSLPEQYEYLGLLDSTLAAASAEWKRKWNVTYWKQKGSDTSSLPKPSGLSSLCKPQGSPKCPIPDMAHSCFQGEPNGSNLPSSSGRQVEKCNVLKNGHQRQHWAEDTCLEAQQKTLEKQGNRARASHSQVRYQPSSSSTTCDTVSHKLSRSMPSNPLDKPNREGHVCPQTRNFHYEAASETLARARVLAKNSKYQCK